MSERSEHIGRVMLENLIANSSDPDFDVKRLQELARIAEEVTAQHGLIPESQSPEPSPDDDR